jgi:hypothetical protein
VSGQRKQLEKVLRGCAELGVPDTRDPWPAIRERVTGERMSKRTSEERASEERVAAEPHRRRVWPSRLVPNTPLGYALAVVSLLILAAGAYAASGPFRELIGYGLPGPGAPSPGETTNRGQGDDGSEDAHSLTYSVFRSHVPGGGGEEIGQTRTADGARVTQGWAYADAKSVVVGYTVEDLEEGRRVSGYPAEFQPLLGSQKPTRREKEYLKKHGLGTDVVDLTDESGTGFRMVNNSGQVSEGPDNMVEGPLVNMVAFKPEERLEPSQKHPFRLEIPLYESPVVPLEEKQLPPEPFEGEPFIFSFEIPVHPGPVVEVNQKDTANGITLTLERVTNSPGRPEAVICFEPQNDVRGWFPMGKDLNYEDFSWVAGKGHCLEMMLNDPLEGHSSVTVEQIELNPANDGELIRGPWRFNFEVPGP